MVVNADMESADERRPLVASAAAATPPVVKTYKRRWYILAVYSALGFMQVGRHALVTSSWWRLECWRWGGGR